MNQILKYSHEQIDELKKIANEQLDLVLSELSIDIDQLYMTGDGQLRGPCYVHDGDNKTAFSYLKQSGYWRCFTKNCHEGHSDIIGLAKLMLSKRFNKQFNFIETVDWLKNLLKLDITAVKVENTNIDDMLHQYKLQEQIRSKLCARKSNTSFKPFPVSYLKNIRPSKYFLDQGFSPEILSKYYVGYCNNPSKIMYLRSYAPVLDPSGQKVIGVTGRIIYNKCEYCGLYHKQGMGCPSENNKIKKMVKWLHLGFSSSSNLYNIWNASEHIKKSRTAVLVEGTKNCWWLEQHGIHNSLCVFGINVSPFQVNELLKIGVTHIILGFDNDIAGERGVENFHKNYSQYFKFFSIKHLMPNIDDISDVEPQRMKEVIVPYLKSLECNTN